MPKITPIDVMKTVEEMMTVNEILTTKESTLDQDDVPPISSPSPPPDWLFEDILYEQDTIVILTVFSVAWLVMVVAVMVLIARVARLRRRIDDIQQRAGLRIQKAKLDSEQQHAFHNPAISPDEELARRGFSMYNAEDVESARGGHADRQTGGEFVEELARELDSRQQRQASMNQQDRMQQDRMQHDRIQQDRMQQDRMQDRMQQDRVQQDRLQQDRHTLPQQHDRQQMQQQQWQQVQQHQQQHPPPFLLQSIEENKRKSRSLANPVANGGRQSATNPNFIY